MPPAAAVCNLTRRPATEREVAYNLLPSAGFLLEQRKSAPQRPQRYVSVHASTFRLTRTSRHVVPQLLRIIAIAPPWGNPALVGSLFSGIVEFSAARCRETEGCSEEPFRHAFVDDLPAFLRWESCRVANTGAASHPGVDQRKHGQDGGS